ncbi:hypothetical protein [Calothrix sp. 336/3]|uniref:hypothetical protein n=1 Tax=Calothrix sp. 336/3 TaxID=1337936 RepID=UPI000A83F48F|nr:hypothetical protein [Calothrix sp. 336/3]
MDGLHDHIQATAKMEGYQIPEATGPVKIEGEQATATSSLAGDQTQTVAPS